jgi:hypothetical protein
VRDLMRGFIAWHRERHRADLPSVGFRPIAPHYQLPAELRDWLVFMQADLA